MAASLLRQVGVRYPHDIRVLLRAVGRESTARVPVLVYHRIDVPPKHVSGRDAAYFVDPDTFAAQMATIAEAGFETILASELCLALAGSFALPPRSIVLTFDDGFASIAEHVPDVLERYGFRATLFLIPGRHGRDVPDYLSGADIRALVTTGSFEFGSHSMAHRRLTRLAPEERDAELRESRHAIEVTTGRPCTVFSYPFGDLDTDTEQAVRAAGYVGAYSSVQGILHAPYTRYRLARVTAPQHTDAALLATICIRPPILPGFDSHTCRLALRSDLS